MANEFKVKKGLIVEGSSGTILDVQGSVGQLFSVTNSLTGDLFAVSDISGVPIFKVNSSGDITLDGLGAGYLKTNVNGVISNTSTIPWSTVSSTPTTISGYGITDALAIGITATTAMAGNTSLFDGAYSSLSGAPTIPSGNSILDWTADQGATNIHTGNYSNTQLSNTEVIGAVVASTAIDAGDKDTIRSNIGAGTSNLAIGATSTTAMAGDTSLFDGAYSSLSGAPTIPSGNAIIDWTTDQGSTNIHSGNYTNTVYSHPTGAGNNHIPSGGSAGEFLKYSASGVAVWATPSYIANTDNQLSQTDVIGMFTAGTNVTIAADGTIAATDTDTVYTHPTSAGNKHIPTGGSAGQFLKYSASGTATWALPSYTTNTDTQYSAGTGLDLSGTTFSIEPDLRDGITKIGKDSSNYIAIDADDNNSIDFYVSGAWVARMEADGDLHMKGDVIAFSDIFNP